MLVDVRKTLIAPFNRTAIIRLIGSMDDAIDEMNQAAKAITLYDLKDFEPQMRDMAGIIVEAARISADAMPLLRDVGRNAARLHSLTERNRQARWPCRRGPRRRPESAVQGEGRQIADGVHHRPRNLQPS